MILFLLDENVDPLFRTQLLQHEPEMVIWKVGDSGAPSRGTLDPEILSWCEEHDFVLVTNNRRSMPVHLTAHVAAGRHVPGILILDAEMTIGETLDELILIWGASHPHEHEDRIVFLPSR